MCGITFVRHNKLSGDELSEFISKISILLKHRGPDERGNKIYNNVAMFHERLAIIDLKTGKQPILANNDKVAILHNGEIYNHEEIKKELGEKVNYKTKSDSESILQLYIAGLEKEEILNKLDGDYAFVIYNSEVNKFLN
jgi:asparagine synthase (glutamine-hydrolysing)